MAVNASAAEPALSTRIKQRGVLALLVALSLWPMAHHVMVRTFEMDPWRLLGFAMYAAPKPTLKVRVVDLAWAPETPQAERELPAAVVHAFDEELEALRAGRQTLGRLDPWRARMASMFDVLPLEVGKISILLSRRVLADDAMLVHRPIHLECLRPQEDEAIECREPEVRFRVAQ